LAGPPEREYGLRMTVAVAISSSLTGMSSQEWLNDN
jgi:hypothetical protein